MLLRSRIKEPLEWILYLSGFWNSRTILVAPLCLHWPLTSSHLTASQTTSFCCEFSSPRPQMQRCQNMTLFLYNWTGMPSHFPWWWKLDLNSGCFSPPPGAQLHTEAEWVKNKVNYMTVWGQWVESWFTCPVWHLRWIVFFLPSLAY